VVSERVREITPYQELKHFFEYMYGDRDGFVYTPTKNHADGQWHPNFFRWPAQKKELIRHFLKPDGRDLYFSPALWGNTRISRESFLGVRVVWADLDYGIPSEFKLTDNGVPAPTIRIRSSTEDRQHWYWKLDYWEDDPQAVEKITKRLAYAIDADLSGWDYQQVLRPPRTVHMGTGKIITIIEKSPTEYGLADFIGLQEPPQGSDFAEEIGDIPDTIQVIAKYKWKEASFDVFRQNQAAYTRDRTPSVSSRMNALKWECPIMKSYQSCSTQTIGGESSGDARTVCGDCMQLFFGLGTNIR